MMNWKEIDWTDRNAMVSKYFSVREALYYPKWNRLANVFQDSLDDAAKEALKFLFDKMDIVREFIGSPILVHCAYRGTAYNHIDNGAEHSAHIARVEQVGGTRILIAAVDWSSDIGDDTPGQACDTLRLALQPKLEELEMRMEDNGEGSPWIHLDTALVPPGGHRFFKP
jgi:hypothetical protein